MEQIGFTESILQEKLIPGEMYRKETEEAIKSTFTKPVIIFGAGVMGMIALNVFKRLQIQVLAICDNYKTGCTLPTGEKIISFQEVYDKYNDYMVLIASCLCCNEIRNDILKYVNNDKIISFPSVKYFPDVFNAMPYVDYQKFFSERSDRIDSTAQKLADRKSREVLRGIIASRLTRNLNYVNAITESSQYFPADIISFAPGEVFVDGGAFTGDTLDEFIDRSGNCFSKAYCFEPGKGQAVSFQKNWKSLMEEGKVILIQKGLWDKTAMVSFSGSNNVSSKISEDSSKEKIHAISIDDAISREEKVTFIKMDIEGSELKALHGAEKTIRANKPRLAICIYHKPEDIFEIPEYIASLNMGYRLFIRHHGFPPFFQFYETVLYAI